MPTVDSVMLDFRAAQFTKRSIKSASKLEGLRLAMSMIDLTTLEGKDSPQKVRGLCRKAVRPHEEELEPAVPSVAAVCVYPALVKVAKEELAGSSVKVASVATGFPSGQFSLDVRLADVRAAVADGADEIDMVINRGAFLAGRYEQVAREIREVKEACALSPSPFGRGIKGEGMHGQESANALTPDPSPRGRGARAHLKIILETGELETYDNIRRAADLAIEAASSVPGAAGLKDGEVFVKTSTGKVTPAATMASTLILLEAVRDHYRRTGVRIGVKPAGGIRQAKQALHYLVMVKETLGEEWLTPRLFRFGASALANDLLRQIVKQTTGHYTASYDFSEA
ncbi:MAG: 2-deoxyribose-5-phosphate aldolase [Phycisphaerales bacterium]|nr:2-deoxyribose-5-phosphate aldolase [Phycisphaerales bacterium]MCI0630357.1 2-deoxyribose-5-phosphate aldolase [Phycisphaerales bacterium]MCI0676385.1 2-deoxyribose-5-phosphate aldolase [Phycisphaerales bacterium]